ncbi:hypothetical protein AAHE18_15G139200 [Arachis hypogaea]
MVAVDEAGGGVGLSLIVSNEGSVSILSSSRTKGTFRSCSASNDKSVSLFGTKGTLISWTVSLSSLKSSSDVKLERLLSDSSKSGTPSNIESGFLSSRSRWSDCKPPHSKGSAKVTLRTLFLASADGTESGTGPFLSISTFFLGDSIILQEAEMVGDMKFFEPFKQAAGDRTFPGFNV